MIVVVVVVPMLRLRLLRLLRLLRRPMLRMCMPARLLLPIPLTLAVPRRVQAAVKEEPVEWRAGCAVHVAHQNHSAGGVWRRA